MDPTGIDRDKNDQELREFVGGTAAQMLKEGLYPSAKQIRRRLGGGDVNRITEHLSDWLKHLSGHANAAADDMSIGAAAQMRAMADSAAAERRAMTKTLERMEIVRDDIKGSLTALGEIFLYRRHLEALLSDLQSERLAIEQLLERLPQSLVGAGEARRLAGGDVPGAGLTARMSRLMKISEEMQRGAAQPETLSQPTFDQRFDGPSEPKK